MITWMIIYHLGFREGFIVDGFKSEATCIQAIQTLKDADKKHSEDAAWATAGIIKNTNDMYCIMVKK